MKTLDWLKKEDSDTAFCDLNGDIDFRQFRYMVATVQTFLLSRNAKSCAIFNENVDIFLAQLMACVISNIDIVLPSNLTSDISKALQVDCQLINCSIADLGPLSELVPLQITPYDCTLTLFTSGSTGKPKAISRRFSQLIEEVTELNNLWSHLTTETVFAASVSQQHIYGLLFKVLWPFYAGVPIWRHDISFEESLIVFKSQQSTVVFISSPAFLKRLQGDSHLSSGTDPVVRQTFSSGGFLNDDFHKQAENHLGSSITQVYGSSETGGIAYRQLEKNWQFFPSVKHRIDDDILWIQSPFCFREKWQNTQDQVIVNKTGMHLLGRADRIAKVEDKRVSLTQLEVQLSLHPLVKEVKVMVLENKKQMIAAVISLKDENKLKPTKTGNDLKYLKDELKRFLKNKVDPVAIPRKIRFVDTMPTDQQGKVTWHVLKQLFEQ